MVTSQLPGFLGSHIDISTYTERRSASETATEFALLLFWSLPADL